MARFAGRFRSTRPESARRAVAFAMGRERRAIRLSNLSICDRIMVIKDGELKEAF